MKLTGSDPALVQVHEQFAELCRQRQQGLSGDPRWQSLPRLAARPSLYPSARIWLALAALSGFAIGVAL